MIPSAPNNPASPFRNHLTSTPASNHRRLQSPLDAFTTPIKTPVFSPRSSVAKKSNPILNPVASPVRSSGPPSRAAETSVAVGSSSPAQGLRELENFLRLNQLTHLYPGIHVIMSIDVISWEYQLQTLGIEDRFISDLMNLMARCSN
jgi:hypothetical protein